MRTTSAGYPDNVTARVFGFVENIHELMNAADVLVSKAGGLTSAEAMALGLPMIIVDPIPGQETRNAEIIVEQRAGWKALDIANLGYKLKRVIEQPEMLATARVAAAGLGKPDAAHDILLDVHNMLNTRGL
jgi:processive 1,2-diacylglycerol beta-glucosyltransferase